MEPIPLEMFVLSDAGWTDDHVYSTSQNTHIRRAKLKSECLYTDCALRRCHHLRTKQRPTQRNVEATLLRSQICMPGYCKIHNLGRIQPQEFDCILKFQSQNAAPAYWVENNVWMLRGRNKSWRAGKLSEGCIILPSGVSVPEVFTCRKSNWILGYPERDGILHMYSV